MCYWPVCLYLSVCYILMPWVIQISVFSLNFCLVGLSIVESRILKSPEISALLPTSPHFSFVNIFFIYLNIPISNEYMSTKGMPTWCIDPSLNYIMTIFASCYSFDLKFILSNITISVLLWFPFAWNAFSFIPLV